MAGQALEEDAKLVQKDPDAVAEAEYHELGEEGYVDGAGYDHHRIAVVGQSHCQS